MVKFRLGYEFIPVCLQIWIKLLPYFNRGLLVVRYNTHMFHKSILLPIPICFANW
jgi:hypothetical protein